MDGVLFLPRLNDSNHIKDDGTQETAILLLVLPAVASPPVQLQSGLRLLRLSLFSCCAYYFCCCCGFLCSWFRRCFCRFYCFAGISSVFILTAALAGALPLVLPLWVPSTGALAALLRVSLLLWFIAAFIELCAGFVVAAGLLIAALAVLLWFQHCFLFIAAFVGALLLFCCRLRKGAFTAALLRVFAAAFYFIAAFAGALTGCLAAGFAVSFAGAFAAALAAGFAAAFAGAFTGALAALWLQVYRWLCSCFSQALWLQFLASAIYHSFI